LLANLVKYYDEYCKTQIGFYRKYNILFINNLISNKRKAILILSILAILLLSTASIEVNLDFRNLFSEVLEVRLFAFEKLEFVLIKTFQIPM